MEVLEATIRVRGEVTFTSREVGRLADTEPYVLNTALYYALGLAGGRYLDTSYEPTYLADTEHVASELYVSPAAPVRGVSPRYTTTTYNASRDEYVVVNYSAQEDPYEGRNLPTFGRRRSLTQGTQLRLYVVTRDRPASAVADDLPTYTRLGKKRGKVRVDLTERPVSVATGSYELGHPIGVDDCGDVPVANVATKSMQPTPLVVAGKYEGEHLVIDRPEEAPGPETVALPRGLVFLGERR
ncbi:type I-D CRISPR-associated protein Cas5/Csc1 [Halobaculum sp. MBLA0147]|uniref:type I-D CRISPR-associated protein Cas5/Csc1 n=1 Tax=Halobaculum sp. MBLA0147 TaxID=3079934 RepID=UPI0035250D5A